MTITTTINSTQHMFSHTLCLIVGFIAGAVLWNFYSTKVKAWSQIEINKLKTKL